MVNDFPRTLSLLRKEKKISQKKASIELQISQALLSHYENGAREPGLAFVVRAADFYSVSCDYLLGRSMLRDGTSIKVDEMEDASTEKGNVMRGSIAAMLNKKLLVNSCSILLDILGKVGDKELIAEVSAYLSAALYKAYRYVYLIGGKHSDSMFPVSSDVFSVLCNTEMNVREYKLRLIAIKNAESKTPLEFPDISIDTLTREYPTLAPALLSSLHNVSQELEKINFAVSEKKL